MSRNTCLFLLVCWLCPTTGPAQSATGADWRPFLPGGLTGAAFKIKPVAEPIYRIRLGLSIQTGLGGQTPGQLFSIRQWTGIVQTLQQPGPRETLHTRLGGEVFLENAAQAVFSGATTTPESSLGLQVEACAGRHWTVKAGIGRGRYSSSANFPVAVFSQQNTGTRQEQGHIRVVVDCASADLHGRYYWIVRKPLRVFTGAGIQIERQVVRETSVALAGLSWPVSADWKSTQYRMALQCGLWIPIRRWPVFFELSAGIALPAGAAPGGVAGQIQGVLGWRF